MFFNSITYFIFLPICVVLYYLIPPKSRWILLLFASITFYLFYKPIYLLLLFVIILLSYLGAIQMEYSKNQKSKQILFWLFILILVSILSLFRYSKIFSQLFHFNNWYDVIFPIGLSFQVFQAISYLTDIYWGKTNAVKNLGQYGLYMLFFPRLMNGPIQRVDEFLPGLKEHSILNRENLQNGVVLIIWGLLKKVVIADRLGIIVDDVYGNYDQYTGYSLAIGVVFFSFQLYFDFSGYTDIAIGSARLFGINISDNFNFPFRSKNISEFWKRWHISLSTWFNDYVFNPIVVEIRNTGINTAIITGLIITFIITGIWHGGKWTLFVYGLIQGLFITLEFLTAKFRKRLSKKWDSHFYKTFLVILIFIMISFSWIFLRSTNFNQATYIILNIFNFNESSNQLFSKYSIEILTGLILITFIQIAQYFMKEKKFDEFLRSQNSMMNFLIIAIITISIFSFGRFDSHPFIYFQF